VGYGIELAVLLDTARRHGLDSVAQVDLGRRGHRHQASHDLAVMAAELLVVADRRRPPPCRPIAQAVLQQFVRAEGGVQRRSRPVPTHERPPLRSLLPAEVAGIAGPTW
jgi:glucosyl-3-phosphoglycerate synthase